MTKGWKQMIKGVLVKHHQDGCHDDGTPHNHKGETMKLKDKAAVAKQETALMFKNLYEFVEACSLTVLLAGDIYLYLHTQDWWKYPVGFSVAFVAQRAAQLWVRQLRKDVK